MQMKAYSVEWKFWLPSEQAFKMILNWKTNKNVTYQQFALEYFNSSLGFKIENLSLLIEAAKPQHSSVYRLEVTDENGIVGCTQFKVFVFDHVEKPQLQGRWKALADRKCHLALSCLGVRGGNVSYTWYRGNELIPTPRNLSFLEVEADVNETHTYTCNVSNPVSWETQNFNLPQGCLSDSSESRLLLFWVIAMILVTLFLGTFAYFCVQKKKQQQSQTNLSGLQIMYEDVRQTRRYQELNTPGEGSTVYSVVQFQFFNLTVTFGGHVQVLNSPSTWRVVIFLIALPEG
ncbi:natural killer cell receptor 2B4 [Ctenodactylus gundi]